LQLFTFAGAIAFARSARNRRAREDGGKEEGDKEMESVPHGARRRTEGKQDAEVGRFEAGKIV